MHVLHTLVVIHKKAEQLAEMSKPVHMCKHIKVLLQYPLLWTIRSLLYIEILWSCLRQQQVWCNKVNDRCLAIQLCQYLKPWKYYIFPCSFFMLLSWDLVYKNYALFFLACLNNSLNYIWFHVLGEWSTDNNLAVTPMSTAKL
jgi:hypothetical protein